MFGLIATAFYTLVSVILRDLADDTDPYWVSCIKAVPTLAAALWLIAQRRRRGQPVQLPWRLVPVLVLVGVIAQVGGNAGSQWSFEVIGLAISIPLMFGTLILGSAGIGIVLYQERLSRRRILAVALIIAAVAVLSLAVHARGEENVPGTAVNSLAALGVLIACLSGIAYAVSHAAIRSFTSETVPLSVPLAVFSLVGIVVLGAFSVGRMGWDGIAATTANQWWRMWAAGVVNAIAYFSLGRALQSLPIVQVNIITASQVALNAIVGVFIFLEPSSLSLWTGVLLTMVGLLIQARWKRPPRVAEPPAAAAAEVDVALETSAHCGTTAGELPTAEPPPELQAVD